MKSSKWISAIGIIGIVALIVGILDFLEGSVVILAGSILVTLSKYLSHDRLRKIFLLSTILIATGVFFLFYMSSLGGFGGESGLSWWYGLFVLPYPIGWILAIALLIRNLISNRKAKPEGVQNESGLRSGSADQSANSGQ